MLTMFFSNSIHFWQCGTGTFDGLFHCFPLLAVIKQAAVRFRRASGAAVQFLRYTARTEQSLPGGSACVWLGSIVSLVGLQATQPASNDERGVTDGGIDDCAKWKRRWHHLHYQLVMAL